MNKYEQELAALKPHDGINHTRQYKETPYQFIDTYGHGYLIVPKSDPHAALAESICEYGYKGNLAFYLEEDCELYEFLNKITIGS